MNGRVYDYNVGRFLSVDPVIVDPTNTQAINPYSYVMNNPLSYTDPSGYSPESNNGNPDFEEKIRVRVKTPGSRITRVETVTVTASGNADGSTRVSVSGGSNGARSTVAGAIAGKVSAAGGTISDIGGSGDIAQAGAGSNATGSATTGSTELTGSSSAAGGAESKKDKIIVGIDGAGSDDLPDNKAIREFGAEIGAEIFNANALSGANNRKIIKFIRNELKENPEAEVFLFGYSAGGAAAIKIANKLARLGVDVSGLVTFDPHKPARAFGFDTFKLKANVSSVVNFYQRNPVTTKRSFGIKHPFGSNAFLGGTILCDGCGTVKNINISSTSVHVNAFSNALRDHENEIRSSLGF
jgi:dienelactone hydrolase